MDPSWPDQREARSQGNERVLDSSWSARTGAVPSGRFLCPT